ncbi:MAG TPA: hypothetical protein PLA50_09250 [Bacteroidia bacterium]|nr:hypothetical protein [Bacteroidia bacterium]
MKRSVIVFLSAILVTAAGWLYWHSTGERQNADRIIAAIEEYRRLHERLPDPNDHEVMKSLGFDLRAGWHPDYQVGERSVYRITILERFDGPYWSYDSSSQTWRKGFPPVDRLP